ncbi:MAG: outer membrane protein assembly factor BamB family protein, partial [Fimbriimonadales bacterium]
FRWRFPVFYPVQGSIGISGSRIFFGAWDNALRAVNLSGVQQWMAPLNSPVESGVAHTPTRVYFTFNLNELRAYNHTGALQWRHNGTYRASTPAVGSDGVVYAVGNRGATVFAVNPANGLVRWSASISTANWYASPAIGGDGTVYVLNGGGRLYAFGPIGGYLWAGGDVDGWDGDYTGRTAIVQFFQDDELKYEMTALVNPDGSIELQDTPVGVHDIKVRIHNSLFGRAQSVALEVDQPAAIQLNLANGDVNGDNIVDDADLLYLLMAYGTHAPEYDLNGDQMVDDADLMIVLFNFGTIGE